MNLIIHIYLSFCNLKLAVTEASVIQIQFSVTMPQSRDLFLSCLIPNHVTENSVY